jgi:integrase
MGVAEPKAEEHDPGHRGTGGITSYRVGKVRWWSINVRLALPGGGSVQYRKRRIPTREQAVVLLAKKRVEAFEGRYFEKHRPNLLTVRQAWELYEPVTKRDNDSSDSDEDRAAHLLRHLGDRRVVAMTVEDVDAYRALRLEEKTRRKTRPSAAQLDREVELLKRVCNYAVAAGKLKASPLAKVKLLKKPNVRKVVIDEEQFQQLVEAADPPLKPILVVAFDTGMRKREVLDLRWSQVDLKTGCIRLEATDTKTEEARVIPMTARVREALKQTPRRLGVDWVFVSDVQKEGQKAKPWCDIGWMFYRAATKAKLPELWFHDLRRSFVTRARRSGISETVVMRLSGHRTHSVFERYNIVEEGDLHEAVGRLDARTQVEQEAGKVAVGGSLKQEAPIG